MSTALAAKLSTRPVSKVELSVRCHNLLDKDFTSKSDPLCLLQLGNSQNIFSDVGRTEQIKNNLNPVFSKSFSLDYYFEETQKLRFFIYDIDNATSTLDDDDFLGSMQCTLGEVVSNSPFTRPLLLKGGKVAGKSTITVTATELAKKCDILHLTFRAEHLDNKDFFSKSDPFLQFNASTSSGTFRLVHRTEVVNNNLNPYWKTFEIHASKLCCKDYNDPIKVECFDHEDSGSHDFIGAFDTTVNQLLEGQQHKLEWPCINMKKKAKKSNYKNSGVIILQSCAVTKSFSFLDYVLGGMQINFTVGIDFTASNGDPSDSRSLHSMHSNNQYIRAIQSVGTVVQDYDSDRMFPALGYGACTPPTNQVSHCFPINFNQANPFCAGIQGVLDAYTTCLRSIRLYGPTNFAPIIQHVSQFASAAQAESNAKNYFVLLIITDGAISDLDATVSSIIHASTLPMSIIIVGVGDADFSSMDFLDCDGGLLRDRYGRQARRDIVQFVPFNLYARSGSQEALAKQVLAEIPDQVVAYYRMYKIEPMKSDGEQAAQPQRVQGPYYDPFMPQQHTPSQNQQFSQQQAFPPQQQQPYATNQQQYSQQAFPNQQPYISQQPSFPSFQQQPPYPQPSQQQHLPPYSSFQQQTYPSSQQQPSQQPRYPSGQQQPPYSSLQHQAPYPSQQQGGLPNVPPGVYQTAQALYPSLPPVNPQFGAYPAQQGNSQAYPQAPPRTNPPSRPNAPPSYP